MRVAWSLVLQAMTIAPAQPPHAAIIPPNATYAACPGAHEILTTGSQLSWGRQSSMLVEHQALRAELGFTVPTGKTRILWYGVGGDLATKTFSVIATRGADGSWHVDGVGRNQIWIQGAKPTLLPHLDRTLDAEESRALDKMIEDPCLYDGPTFANNPRITVGALAQTLEVETPRHHWVGGWQGMPTDQEQAITNLIGKE